MTIRSIILIGLLFVAMWVCAFVGWSQLNTIKEPMGLTDIAYRAFKALTLSDSYDPAGSKNIFIEVLRWIGVGLFSTAAIGLGAQLFKNQWLGLKPALRKNHLFVIGDTPIARAIVDQCRLRSVKSIHMYKDAALSEKGTTITAPFTPDLWRHSLTDAKTIIFAIHDDVEAIGLAAQASQLTKSLAPKADILVDLSDSGLAQSLHRLDGLDNVRSFRDRALAARELMRRHPLFLLAEDFGQDRIHVHLIGGDDFVEAVLLEMLLSSLTLRFGVPTVFIDVDNGEAFAARLKDRYPELDQSVALDFAPPTSEVKLTATYIAFDDAVRTLNEAMSLREQAIRHEGSASAIFVHMAQDGLYRPTAGDRLDDHALVPFGAQSDIIKALEVFADHVDATAKAYHQSYLDTLFALYPDAKDEDKPANRPWARLPEEYRASNRLAAAHLPAKLFDAGFDIRPWLHNETQWSALPTLSEPLFRDEAELLRLGEAEHLRWNADRRIMGWIYGKKRDNKRRIHPNLTDYAALDEGTKAFDLDMIKHINHSLPQAPSGLKRV